MLNTAVPLVFGEVLFDVFNNRHAVLGGAPFNVAWHLQGFGFYPLFISRIGRDKNGEKIKHLMKRWNMSLDGVQLDSHHPTGIVSVQTRDGDHSFTIEENQAYDNIDSSGVVPVLKRKSISLIYHGSLALRNHTSQRTFETILQKANSPVFLDVNLRSPWWTHEILRKFLKTAHWVKCNRDELDVLAALTRGRKPDLSEKAKSVVEFFNLNSIIVTLGADGALILDNDGELSQSTPVPVKKIVDTVGAGDAFSAVSIMGILKSWNIKTILERALRFASRICEVRGATLNDRDYYFKLLKIWDEQDENA
jgi:fructokinase